MRRREESRRECVLRALVATEIADTCTEPALRDSFFQLAEQWLDRAYEIEDAPADGTRLQ
jgi:hypothetical protein